MTQISLPHVPPTPAGAVVPGLPAPTAVVVSGHVREATVSVLAPPEHSRWTCGSGGIPWQIGAGGGGAWPCGVGGGGV